MPRRKKAAQTGAGRTAIPIALLPRVNEVVNGWCDRTGGSKTRFVERLVEFWAAAPDSVQRAMLGDVPADLRDEVVTRAASYFGEVAERSGRARPEDPGQPMRESSDLGETIKRREPLPANHQAKAGRRTGTPLPPARGGALPAERLR